MNLKLFVIIPPLQSNVDWIASIFFTWAAESISNTVRKAFTFYNPQLIVGWPKAAFSFLKDVMSVKKGQSAPHFFYLYSYLSSFRVLALKLSTALESPEELYETQDFGTPIPESLIQ